MYFELFALSILTFFLSCDAPVKQESATAYSLGKRHMLPAEVRETSGLIKHNGLVWTFNDSGGKPQIYGINLSNDSLEQTITLKNAINEDWEDITQDNSFIYIGDFGNNQGTRDSLVIYKIPKESLPQKGNQDINAERIVFSYPGYKPVSLAVSMSPYDCEAFVVVKENIYLFSKNWLDGTSTIYSLPKTRGKYVAKKITTLNTQGLVTGASFQDNKLALIGYSSFVPFILKYTVSSMDKITDSQATRYDLDKIATYQTEGICFDDSKILISSEQTRSPAQIIEVILH